MSRETLKREPIVVNPVEVDESREFKEIVVTPLFEECGKLLHYLTPEERTRQTREAERQLQLALAELEIEPFSASSIRKYKRIRSFAANLPRRIALVVLSGTALVFCAMSIVLAASGQLELEKVLLPFGLFALLWIACGTIQIHLKHWQWRRSFLRVYPGTVPEFALARALEIRKKSSNSVQIWVEYLAKESLKNDPFLVVGVESVEYYLEVWDEPRFKPQSL